MCYAPIGRINGLALALGVGIGRCTGFVASATPRVVRGGPTCAGNRFRRACGRELELDRVRLHDLRHFCARRARRWWGADRHRQRRGTGQQRLSTTLDLYTHAIPATRSAGGRLPPGSLAGRRAAPNRCRPLVTVSDRRSVKTGPRAHYLQVPLREPA